MQIRGIRSRWRQRRARESFQQRHDLEVPDDASVGEPRLVTNGALITIGHRVTIRPGARLEVVPVTPGSAATGSLRIGDGTQFEDMVAVSAAGDLVIGADCLIASFVTISDNDHTHGAGRILDRPQAVATTTIGSGVWIGVGAVVVKGVTIGDGAVVGANAVVTRDVAAGITVGGVPAKPLRSADG